MRMWQTISSSSLTRHSHKAAYAALILSGGYDEAGDQGRFQGKAGEVLFHESFESHTNHFFGTGAVVLNIALPEGSSFSAGIMSIANPDLVARAAERSMFEAVNLLLSMATRRHTPFRDWPDELADALIRDPSVSFTSWGEKRGLAPWALSRGFKQVFAISPSAFRARVRARKAWMTIKASEMPLAAIAADLGFADQAHMTRSVKALTGWCPRAWRTAANGFKTSQYISA